MSNLLIAKLISRQPERDIQQAICQVLTLHGWFCLEYGQPGGHDGLRGSVPPGHPDIIAWKAGRGLLLEVKSAIGFLSTAQRHMHRMLGASGVTVHTVRSVKEALEAANEQE